MQIYTQIIIVVVIYSRIYTISVLSPNACEFQDWFVTARGGTFKLHLNLLLLCPPGCVTLRANATRPQDTSLHIQYLLQTSFIAGLPFSPPSLVANYTSFNKAVYRPWISLWAANRLQSPCPSEEPRSEEAPHGELHPRSSHELRGPHHHSSSLNYLLKSSRQT